MKQSTNGSLVKTFLVQHWFKVALMSIVLYLFVQKDFRFSVNLNAPNESEFREASHGHYTSKANQKKQIFTERKNDKGKILDKFELPSLFSRPNKYNPAVDLEKVDEKLKHDYLKRFARVVINERRKFGIPSSILLACGLLQSHAGQRDMAKQGNNHFALNCTLGWEGASGSYRGTCYRHYENAWTSFRDHSAYLSSGKYAQLTTLESTDYKSWARGLEQLGYGNGLDNIEKQLISIIEEYGLQDLDKR